MPHSLGGHYHYSPPPAAISSGNHCYPTPLFPSLFHLFYFCIPRMTDRIGKGKATGPKLRFPDFLQKRSLHVERKLQILPELQKFTKHQITQRGWTFLERPSRSECILGPRILLQLLETTVPSKAHQKILEADALHLQHSISCLITQLGLRVEVVWEDAEEKLTVAGSKRIIPNGNWFQSSTRRQGRRTTTTTEAYFIIISSRPISTLSTIWPAALLSFSQPIYRLVQQLFLWIDKMDHRNKRCYEYLKRIFCFTEFPPEEPDTRSKHEPTS
ncbi:hypothetical protein AHAS_Ahas10G0145800 [Arachis hypogaea]